jgi:hypothetical protein
VVIAVIFVGSGAGGTAACAVMIAGAYYALVGELLAELPVSPTPTSSPIAIEGGRRVQLTLHAGSYAAGSTCDRLAVDIELMHEGFAFQSYGNHGWVFRRARDRGAPLGTTMTVATIQLPPSGVDAIRSWYRFEPAGCGGEMEGLVVQVREPRF